MKPVTQALINSKRGDCFRCCIASILELERDQVPNFADLAVKQDIHMDQLYLPWLRERGFGYISTKLYTNWGGVIGAYCICYVPSQLYKSTTHCVVGHFTGNDRERTLNIVHDPNPGNKPYDVHEQVQSLGFILVLDPCQMIKSDIIKEIKQEKWRREE